jgi:methyl-accepting chemotaxis protein
MVSGQAQAKASVDDAKQAESSLTSITQAVEQISEVNNIISQTAADQRIAVEETSKTLHSIAQISIQTSNDSRKTYEANAALSQLAEQLKDVVSQFKV